MTAPAKAAPMREDVTQAEISLLLDTCPHCGNAARFDPDGDEEHDPRYWVECTHCGARGPEWSIPAKAIAAWNIRLAHTARPDAQPDTVEFVREWLMSSDHPVSDWERQFASAIEARITLPDGSGASDSDGTYARSLIIEMLYGDARAIDRAIIDPDDRVMIDMVDIEALVCGLIVGTRPDAGDEDVERVASRFDGIGYSELDLEIAQKAACAIVPLYGDGSPGEQDAARAGKLWNDHPAVQGALRALHESRSLALAAMREGVDRGMVEQVQQLREELRVLMLRQQISDERNTYGDGFGQGLCYAIGKLDNIVDLARAPLPAPPAKDTIV
ncbi:Lar family restriction alleviation protein [Sphingomonas echinoides]|uniref:Lar family restriction alleviation protein n=1 Tax=Sphingomonas echinoides TaxID=59803 RepID=UPI002413530F|nr:Lar family restriction alleviation protein [Sphingomonas echinoides]